MFLSDSDDNNVFKRFHLIIFIYFDINILFNKLYQLNKKEKIFENPKK